MLILIIGLFLFLGVHSFTMFRRWRALAIDRIGLRYYKFSYTAKSVIGLVLIVWGFYRYRHAGLIEIWYPPYWLHYVSAVLVWLAFISFAAVLRGPSKIRGYVRHPMLVAVKFWALAHLLSNGDLGGIILFGSFLAWAVADRISVKKRGDYGAPRHKKFTTTDAFILALGTVAFVAMVFLHPYIIGVPALIW